MSGDPDWGRGFTHPLSGGGHLHVREAGEGPPLLLLHGFTGSSLTWSPAALVRLQHSFRVIAPDLPGHGLSPVPTSGEWGPGSEGAIERLASELVSLVRGLGVERFPVLGYSMGGRLALALAAGFPGAVDALILESASPGLEGEDERAERRRSDGSLADAILARGMDWFVDHWTSLPLFETRHALPASVAARVREGIRDNDPAGLAFALRRFGTGSQPSYWGRLKDLGCPTLLIAGAVDRKFARINREMAAEIPECRLVVVPGIGHTVHLESPDLWTDLVSLYLQRHSSAPGPAPVLRGGG